MKGLDPKAHLTKKQLKETERFSQLSLLATRAIRHWLYGVTPLEPMSYLLAILVLVGAVAFACWWPARRALRVDPLVALRAE